MTGVPTYNLVNSSGAAFRASLNALLVAIASINRGSSQPVGPQEGQVWEDTTTTPSVYKAYKGGAWVSLFSIDANSNFSLTSTGSFDLPSGTTAQRTGSPNGGMIRFNTTFNQYEGYDGAAWTSIGGGATGGGSDNVFYENAQAVTSDYTLSAGTNAMSTGPITINSGVTVTVGTGQNWVVL